MGEDDQGPSTRWRPALSRAVVTRALIAVCVVATARKVKLPLPGRLGNAPGGDDAPARRVAPFTQPADGWTKRLSKAQLAQLDARRGVAAFFVL